MEETEKCETMPAIFTLHMDLDEVNEEGGSNTSWVSALICMVALPVEPDLRARTGGFVFRTGGCSEVERDNPRGCGWVKGTETECDGQATGTDAKGDVDPVSV